MARRIIDIPEPDRFAAGTVGEPGDRTFFLQVVRSGRVISVALEKEQVAILAQRLLLIIDELERRGLTAVEAGAAEPDEQPLDEPLREEFRVGTLSIAWDGDIDRVIVEAQSLTFDAGAGESALLDVELEEEDIPDDEPIGPDVLRVRLTPLMAQQFARGANRIIAAGRPRCPFCGEPLEPTGHLCARRDGSGLLN